MSFDFGQYVTQQKTGFVGEGRGDIYAYSGDLKLLKTLRSLRPVELAVASLVRLGKGVVSGDLLGTAVRVSPKQYPQVYEITQSCAKTLGIPMPTVYVQGKIDSINAYTYGTDRESVIVLHSIAVDFFTPEELKFVIGHECGHIQNGHVVYLTVLRGLTSMAERLLGGFVQPALLFLQSWSRAAEVTCDRAGLLCCKDLRAAQHAFLKLVTGSKSLYQQLNVEEYLQQLAEAKESIGRAAELHKSHPYIPKRIEAVRLFAESDLFRKAIGLQGGIPLVEVDRQVEEVIKVI